MLCKPALADGSDAFARQRQGEGANDLTEGRGGLHGILDANAKVLVIITRPRSLAGRGGRSLAREGSSHSVGSVDGVLTGEPLGQGGLPDCTHARAALVELTPQGFTHTTLAGTRLRRAAP